MADVIFEYNPFTANSYITVDGTPISETSGIYKYIKTPLQDWIEDFFAVLTEHCNDDEINLTYKGLYYNFYEIKNALSFFIKNNPCFNINLDYQECMDLKSRMDNMNCLANKTQSYGFYENNEFEEIQKSLECKMKICVFGRDYEYYQRHIKQLSEIVKKDNKIIECDFVPFNSVNQVLHSDNSIIIYYFNDDKIFDFKILKCIADEYKQNRKTGKSRFIFVSSSPKIIQNMLEDMVDLKSVTVLDEKNASEICKRIYDYQNNVYMINRLLDCTHLIYNHLINFEQKLRCDPDENIKIENIDIV
ncbi:MAG: hypothetical protein ACI4YB_11985 [Oscillospiraceae bacterium]